MHRIGDYRTTAVLLLLVLVVAVVMQGFFPKHLVTPIPGSTATNPVLAFEMAAEPAHLDHVFGEVGHPSRAENLAKMDAGNRVDYAFMPVYGLFVFSFLAAIGRELGRPWCRWVGALALVAAAADAIENQVLLRMTADIAHPAAGLYALPYPVWTKFGLLALTCGAGGVALFAVRRPFLALLCLPAPLLILPAIAKPLVCGSFVATAIGVGWLAMGIHAVHRAVWPLPASVPAR